MKGGQFDLMADRLGSISRPMTCGSAAISFAYLIIHFPRSLATHCCHRKKPITRDMLARVHAFSLSHAPVTSPSNRVAKRA